MAKKDNNKIDKVLIPFCFPFFDFQCEAESVEEAQNQLQEHINQCKTI